MSSEIKEIEEKIEHIEKLINAVYKDIKYKLELISIISTDTNCMTLKIVTKKE